MSHHLDSPASRRDPRLNLTDLYVFDGQTGTSLVMIVNTSLAGESRVAGFHPEARYEFKVHLDGAEREDLTYRVSFDPPSPDGEQIATVRRLDGADAADDSADGTVIARGATGAAFGDGGVQVWAGAAADPFYLDLNQLAHIIEGIQHRERIDLGDWTLTQAASSFTGSSIYAIVLEIPGTDEWLRPGRQIGVWGTTKLATDAGGWRPINRAAIPMMWPLFRAFGGDDDSAEYLQDTTGHPSGDRTTDGPKVREMITAAARFSGTRNPDAYAEQVTARLLPDVLPYRVGSPAAFGFAGFNGRSLGDNAPEVMYSLITNTAFATGLTAADAAETHDELFPYVVPVKPGDLTH